MPLKRHILLYFMLYPATYEKVAAGFLFAKYYLLNKVLV